jgi:hypothetical protein
MSRSHYDSFAHFARMLGRTPLEWSLAMLEVYFDDSVPTDWAAAACYVSSERQWASFNRGLKLLAASEGFIDFHMTDLASGGGEFLGWTNTKKKRVYKAMAALIRGHIQHGFAIAFQKSDYDACIPEYIKNDLGRKHYPVAVDFLIGKFMEWRLRCAKGSKVQYFFDRNTKGTNIRTEIQRIEETIRKIPGDIERFGLTEDGFSEQSKSNFRPLQAADVLAWQWSHFMMAKSGLGNPGSFYGPWQMIDIFDPKRYDCGWIERKNFQKWVSEVYEHESDGAMSAFLANSQVDSIDPLNNAPRQRTKRYVMRVPRETY